MKKQGTSLSGVYVVASENHDDSRGRFARLFCAKALAPIIGDRSIVQINHSQTTKSGTVRGLHYQKKPYSEMKLIRCLKGAVWDVAVDLRKGSATFLKWYAQELTPENNLMMVAPEGVAHGFQTLKPDTELLYLHTEYYQPIHEAGVRYDDALINISWPLNVEDVSDRDLSFSLIDEQFKGLEV